MITPWIKKINNIEHGKIKIDDSIYSVPQFLINHVRLQEQAIADRDKQVAELQASKKDMQIRWAKDIDKISELQATIKANAIAYAEANDFINKQADKLHRRNMQIDDLKKLNEKYYYLLKEVDNIASDDVGQNRTATLIHKKLDNLYR